MNGALKIIGDQLRHYPEQLLRADKLPNEMSEFLAGQNVYIVVSLYKQIAIHELVIYAKIFYYSLKSTAVARSNVQISYDQLDHQCGLAVAQKKFWKRKQCLSFQKNSPFTKTIDRQYVCVNICSVPDLKLFCQKP